MEYDERTGLPVKKGVGYYIRKILFAIAILIVLLMFGVLIFRSCSISAPDEVKRFSWSKEAYELYRTSPEDFGVTELPDYNVSGIEDIFTVLYPRYIGSLGEFQCTIRYNENKVNELRGDAAGKLTEFPQDLYSFALRDKRGNYYLAGECRYTVKNEYHFYTLIFKNVDLTDPVELSVLAFSGNPIDMKHPVELDLIYRAEDAQYYREYKLSGSEIPASPTEGFGTFTLETQPEETKSPETEAKN